LSFGFMQVQPSEGAKLVAIMMSAAYLGACIDKGRQVTGNLAQLFVFALFVVLIEKQPDAGTMCIVIGIPFFMYIIAGLKRKYIERLFAAAVVGVVLVCLLQPYRMERLKVWFDPWQDTQNFGYQTVQSMSAIGSGGLWGMGLGKGISKYAYLPEAHTDFAFAIFCQENGFLGVAFMFMLFVAFSLYSARIASRAPDGFGQMLASGIIMLIVGQGFINIAMVVGVVPVIGVPLPFISYGGTSLIVNMAAVGILINVGQHAKKSENNHTDKESENMAEQKRHLRLVKR
jgi:cell division protein FtsW